MGRQGRKGRSGGLVGAQMVFPFIYTIEGYGKGREGRALTTTIETMALIGWRDCVDGPEFQSNSISISLCAQSQSRSFYLVPEHESYLTSFLSSSSFSLFFLA